MMNFLRKHTHAIFIVTIITFIGGTFIGTGAHLFGPKEDLKTVVTVNGEKIPIKLFNSFYINSRRAYKQATNKELTESELNQIKIKILQDLVENEIFYQQSKTYGITVSNEELKADLQSSEIFRNNNAFDIQRYHSFLNSIQMTPKEYESLRKKQIAVNKVKMIIISSIKLWNYEFENALRQDPSITKNALIQKKINIILNECYSDYIKNSKITSNNTILNV